MEPGKSSSTRVIYVNPAGVTDRSNSYYTIAPGNDAFEGLNYRKPKASLASVLATYDLGPNDIVVFDNWRVMHGRSRVEGETQRLHDRIWIRTMHPEIQVRLGLRPLPAAAIARLTKPASGL